MTPRWSIVIPAYNEAHRLPAFLDTVVAYFDGRDEPYEVIVVDDGSADHTSGAVEGRRFPAVTVLRRERNAGKGAAVRMGMLAARGAYRLFADADGATPIEELKRIEPALVAGADVVIGSRALHDPAISVVARRHRVVAGRAFHWVVGRLGLEGLSDTQCGFKAFTARAAEHLFQALSIRGLAFDVELLLLARAAGYRIVEVPVNWSDQPGGKVGVLRHGPGMLWHAARARLRIDGTGGTRRRR
jgi:dolichyl-phosphate beta-glucosyltransferase